MQGLKSVAKAGPAPPGARVMPVAWLDRLPWRRRAQLAGRQRPLLSLLRILAGSQALRLLRQGLSWQGMHGSCRTRRW